MTIYRTCALKEKGSKKDLGEFNIVNSKGFGRTMKI